MARKTKDSGSGGKKGASKRPPPGPAMAKTPGKAGASSSHKPTSRQDGGSGGRK